MAWHTSPPLTPPHPGFSSFCIWKVCDADLPRIHCCPTRSHQDLENPTCTITLYQRAISNASTDVLHITPMTTFHMRYLAILLQTLFLFRYIPVGSMARNGPVPMPNPIKMFISVWCIGCQHLQVFTTPPCSWSPVFCQSCNCQCDLTVSAKHRLPLTPARAHIITAHVLCMTPS